MERPAAQQREPGERSTAFTLIELLIVVAVIAVLAAMLLPTLQKAKSKAQQSVCSSNLRQIFLAFSTYALDSNDSIPIPAANGDPTGWSTVLGQGRYLGRSLPMPLGRVHYPVTSCPAEKQPMCLGASGYDSYYGYWNIGASYAINATVQCDIWSGVSRSGFSRAPTDCVSCNGGGISPGGSMAPSRSEAPFLMDCPDFNYGSLPVFDSSIDNPNYWTNSVCPSFNNYYYAFRHLGFSANMMYLDGHLESIRPKYMGGRVNWYWIWNYRPP